MPQDNGYDDASVAAAAARILSKSSAVMKHRLDPPAQAPVESIAASLEHSASSMLRRELNEERAAHNHTRLRLEGLRDQVSELEAALQAARELDAALQAAREQHSLVASNQARRIAELEQENAILRGIRAAPDQGDIELVDF